MPFNPLVSVVVPTYRRPHYLAEAIASVIAQDERAWEMLVCDDGRDDQNRRVVEAFADSRIRYRRNPRRLGVGANKFVGWQAATGRYVANLDDDDLWEPNFLGTLVPYLEADPGLTVAFSSHHVIDAKGRIDEQQTERLDAQYRGGLAEGRHEPFARLALVDQAIPTANASIFRRAAVDWHDFPSDVDVVADYWLAYLVSREPGGAYYCPRRLTRHRVHQQSATAAVTGWHASSAACYRRFLRDARIADLHDVFKARLADAERRLAVEQVRTGRLADARRSSQRALAAKVDARAIATAVITHSGPLGREVAKRL